MKDKLKKIEKLGSLFFTIEETSILLNIPVDEFIDNKSDVYTAYYKGLLNSELELRQEIIDTAKQGSPAAQETAQKLIQSTKSLNSKHG